MRLLALLLVSLITCFNRADADVIVSVIAHSAPNQIAVNSSWDNYVPNALFGIENGVDVGGDRNINPEAFEAFADGEKIPLVDNIVGNFSLWRGDATPGAGFLDERGNRVHFGLHILGDGVMQFRLADLEFSMTSTDGDFLGFNTEFSADPYAVHRIGIDWVDGIKGNGNDVVITSGSGTQLVDEIIYTGVGNAYDATAAGSDNQQKVQDVIDSRKPFLPILLTGTYIINDPDSNFLAMGSASVQFVPEPGTTVLMIFAGVGLVLGRRRK